MQSNLQLPPPPRPARGAHHGRQRPLGHRAGAEVVRRIVQAAPGVGIGTLTLFAFSSDNWQRPQDEIRGLMEIFEHYLRTQAVPWVAQGVRVNVLGRRDRLTPPLRASIECAEEMTRRGQCLCLRLAIDYSARETLVQAAREFKKNQGEGRDSFSRILARAMHGESSTPEVDLVIRTGGEQRLSDFLLWECAYAELFFTQVLWPDFNVENLKSLLEEFHSRHRRFGRIAEAAAV
ncbi:MAG: polyprenyl diphosphate synthase [Terriglobia bacterium]